MVFLRSVLNYVILSLFPIFLILSLNTLFPVLTIPYNIWTWLAVVYFHFHILFLKLIWFFVVDKISKTKGEN